jgi:competence protein ComEC
MIGVVFFAMIIDRQALSLRLVALAAMIIMLFTPSAMMGASFQMSFAAVLAMIAAYETKIDRTLVKASPQTNSLSWLHRGLFYLRDIILTSIIATAATTPFTIFHFQTFSFYGVLANIIGIPLTTLWIMPCLLLTYLTLPFGLADVFILGAGWGVNALIQLAHEVAQWPYAKISFPSMPQGVIASLIIGGLWLCLWKTKWRYFGFLPITLACFYPLIAVAPFAYISDDKPVWAVMLRDGRLAVYGKKTEDFTIGQWLQHSGASEAIYLNEKKMSFLPDELSCDADYCAFKPPSSKGKPPVIFLHTTASPKIVTKICNNRSLFVITFSPHQTCDDGWGIDAKQLQEKGAHSLTIKQDNIHIMTARKETKTRPWSFPSAKQSHQ